MKKFLLFIAFCVALSTNLFSQASSATAVTVTPVVFTGAPTMATYSLVLGSAQTFNTCVGSQSVYWFKFNIPVPSISTNGTRSVKITANSGSFSPVIDFYDSAVTFKECVTGNVMRTTPTTNAIIPGQDYYFRISSTTLATGSSFTLAVEYYPVAEVRSGYYPTVDADGYGLCDQIKRNNVSGVSVTNTRFRLVPTTTPNNGGCTATVTGSNTIVLTNQFTCACFGINYDCYVEVQVDGHWCGESLARPIQFQSGPSTNILSTSPFTFPLDSTIGAAYACGGSDYQWRFVSQNGTTITCDLTNNSSIDLDIKCNCLRYNRIYQVMVRVRASCNSNLWSEWCGLTGPNSDPLIMYTPPMPAIIIPANKCNTVLAPFTYLDVDYIANVSNYHFQSTRVSPTPPYAPIAAPVVIINNTNSGYVIVGNTAGATYRTCFKPSITSCNSPQEGSWGPYCYYAISPGTAPSGMTLENPQEDNAVVQVVDESISENPLESNVSIYKNGGETIVMIDLKENLISGDAQVRMYNLNGQLVYADNFVNSTGVSVFQLGMPSDLANGTYIMHITCDTFSTAEKVVFAGMN
ncbi:MAG: hypothetical protein RL204_1018 [Bacteroidota bacterium]|jgi:hypothetical protein